MLKLTDAVGKFDQRQQAFEEHLQVFDRRQQVFEDRQRAFEQRLQAFDVQQQGFDEALLKQWEGITEIKGRLSGIEIVMRGLPTT